MGDSNDGLILNLAFDPVPTSTSAPRKNNIKGGSWKERRAARRAIQDQFDIEHGITKESKNANSTELGERKSAAADKKEKSKPKLGGSSTDFAKDSHIPGWKKHKMAQEKKRKKNVNDEEPKVKKVRIEYKEKPQGKDGNTFVSSIFTNEQKEEMKKLGDNEVDDEDLIAQEASNAPLKGDSNSFPGLGISDLLSNIIHDRMKLDRPTKIQRAAVPKLLTQDRDLFVQAQTGSGKTLAFCLPILERLCHASSKTKIDRNSGLFAVIMTPTRELAQQIYSVLETLCRGCNWIVPGIVTGGEKKKSEKARIRKGINVLVATPGRLADHIENTESLDLAEVRWVVMDEGDRLMELGFEETITKILKNLEQKSAIGNSRSLYDNLPRKRVNVLCSATIKGDVKKLGDMSLKDADKVSADSIVGGSTVDFNDVSNYQAPAQLIQESIVVPAKLRLATLASSLRNIANKNPDAKVIVFFSCADSVDFHFSIFTRESESEEENDEGKALASKTVLPSPWIGENAVIHKLHGSLTQQNRTTTLNSFSNKTKDAKQGRPSILFCTDVASRGLDLPSITNVIEYDPPFATEDHVHRVGRTARAGQEGQSVLFLLPGKEEGYLDLISSFHPHGIHSVSYVDVMKKAFGKQAFETEATTWHLNIERWLLEDAAAHARAKRAFTSHIRAYTTHLSTERDVFNLRDLHLGHIAKSFGLRETPGNMGENKKQKAGKGKKGNTGANVVKDFSKTVDTSGKNKFLAKARAHARGMDEFNIS